MIPHVDLREAVRKQPLLLEGIEKLGPADLENARQHWRIHMVAEFSSARVFSGLVPQMMAAGIPFEHVRDVTDMAREEVEHGLMCARVYAALGGTACSALPALDRVPWHEGADPLEVVLRNVISVSCCGETLAVAVIGAERERVTDKALRDVLTRILADEVGHARMGWRLLKDVGGGLDESMRRRLSAYVVAVFERDLRIMAVALRDGPSASDAALAMGATDGELAFSTFVDTMCQVSVPGLERHGIAAGWAFARAWQRAGITSPCPLPRAA